MTTEERFERIETTLQKAADAISSLANITAALTETTERHDSQIANILTAIDQLRSMHDRTDTAVRAMADEVINTQREWQAYLRRIPRQ